MIGCNHTGVVNVGTSKVEHVAEENNVPWKLHVNHVKSVESTVQVYISDCSRKVFLKVVC